MDVSRGNEEVEKLSTDSDRLFQAIEEYNWTADADFQNGLQAILSSNPDPAKAEHLIMRARCFYFSRKCQIPVDFDAYRSWRGRYLSPATGVDNNTASSFTDRAPEIAASAAQSSDSVDLVTPNASQADLGKLPSSGDLPAPYPTSFSEIVELISSGRPIQGIRDIPDTVLEGQRSSATKTPRKKPWERCGSFEKGNVSTPKIVSGTGSTSMVDNLLASD